MAAWPLLAEPASLAGLARPAFAVQAVWTAFLEDAGEGKGLCQFQTSQSIHPPASRLQRPPSDLFGNSPIACLQKLQGGELEHCTGAGPAGNAGRGLWKHPDFRRNSAWPHRISGSCNVSWAEATCRKHAAYIIIQYPGACTKKIYLGVMRKEGCCVPQLRLVLCVSLFICWFMDNCMAADAGICIL